MARKLEAEKMANGEGRNETWKLCSPELMELFDKQIFTRLTSLIRYILERNAGTWQIF